MTTPRNSLQAVLVRQAASTPEPLQFPESVAVAKAASPRPSREGKRLIAGHFDPKVAKQLRLLAAEEDTSIQALLEEALDLLFVKKGKNRIAKV